MAWYSDEQYTMIQDCREKKSTAASAFKQRTHCGKGGGVKLPSDYMSRKEIKAMNGECVTYRMNDPIAWEEFKTWPEEHQKNYIVNLREKYKIPGTALAKAMGVEEYRLRQYVKCLGLNQGKEAGATGRLWHESEDARYFWAWWNGEEIPEEEKTPDLRKPMSWDMFKKLPDDLKVEYINWIRDYFGAPDKHIAETLFRISDFTMRKVFTAVGLSRGKTAGSCGIRCWNKESFIAWCAQNKKTPVEGPVMKVECVTPENIPETEVVDTPDIPEESTEEITPEIITTCNTIPVIPKSGSMTFENNYTEDILATLKTLLDIPQRINLTVTWEFVN